MDGGFSSQGLEPIGPALQAVVDAGDLSGYVILVWRKGEVVQVQALGQRDIAAGKPMTRDTIFRIASMTKPVTSTAALMLMEEGRLRLDDPITRWAPEFADMQVLKAADGPLDQTVPAARDITIEDLMTHRAGLAYGFTSGQRSHYSHATDVLGFTVARIEGGPLGEVLRRRIFEPLGMKDTGFHLPLEKQDRGARLYRIGPETDALEDVSFPYHPEPPAFDAG
ncbi:MAG TPA: serine hydrolase domain-containing protein, partial [Phenylobacterium sp.]|nr:serine hydrolase domain-containing protein [Phenylobacterium sp.]